MFKRMRTDFEQWYVGVMRSQIMDTQCVFDRMATYWKWWFPIVAASLMVIWCCGIAITCCWWWICFKHQLKCGGKWCCPSIQFHTETSQLNAIEEQIDDASGAYVSHHDAPETLHREPESKKNRAGAESDSTIIPQDVRVKDSDPEIISNGFIAGQVELTSSKETGNNATKQEFEVN